MKSITIPLTERQVGWLVFTTLFGLFSTWTFILFIQNVVPITGVYVLVGIDLGYAFLAFLLDGRHDMNPAHWVGYCLKLKESKTKC